MTTRFQVSEILNDDETLSRKAVVKLGTSGQIKFETPSKVGVGSLVQMPIYEAYKSVTPDTIKKCLESEENNRYQFGEIKKRCKGRFNILTLEYDSKYDVPTDKMIAQLSDMQYDHTNAITTPSWYRLIAKEDGTDADLYLNLTGKYLDVASTRNNKPIIGNIPNCIPAGKLERVIKFYIDRDVTSFVVDYNSHTFLSSPWIRTFHRIIDSYDIEKECITYSINAFQGIIQKNQEKTEAKDFLEFSVGFDIMGEKHTRKYSQTNENGSVAIGRIFERNTYNYRKKKCSSVQEVQALKERSILEQNEELKVVRTAINEKSIKQLLMEKDLLEETRNEKFRTKKDTGCSLDGFI